jgi:hypothetical protein
MLVWIQRFQQYPRLLRASQRPAQTKRALFVAADPDLVAKGCGAQDSWFVISHPTSGSNRLDLSVHYIRLTPPQAEPIQAMVSVRILSAACRSRKRIVLTI